MTMALEAGGISVVPVVVGGRAYLREARQISRVIAQLRPEVVHTHGYRSDVIGGWAAIRAGLPTIATLHGFTARSLRGHLFEWLQLRGLRRFDGVVGVSPGIVDRARASGVRDDRLRLIPNAWSGGRPGVDRAELRRSLGIPADAFAVGWIGRLSREKGADVFVEALAKWMPSGVIASVIGDGRERRALEALGVERGVSHLVQWHGALRDAGHLMKAFDVFVLSSRTEGVPMVLLEAMDAQTPIVTTAVGGVPSVVDSNEALLVAPESPAALAAALEAVRMVPDAARERAANAKRRLETQFAIEPWLDRYIDAYARIIAARGNA
jgi:glycosyltransferase involved in cell wall biosynthesis